MRLGLTNNLCDSYCIIKMTITSHHLKANDMGVKQEQNFDLWVNPFSDLKEIVLISNQYFNICLWSHSLTSSNFILFLSACCLSFVHLFSLRIVKMLSVILAFRWKVHLRKNNCWGQKTPPGSRDKHTWWIFSPGFIYSSLENNYGAKWLGVEV